MVHSEDFHIRQKCVESDHKAERSWDYSTLFLQNIRASLRKIFFVCKGWWSLRKEFVPFKNKSWSRLRKKSFKSALKFHYFLVHEKERENYINLLFEQSSNPIAEYLQSPRRSVKKISVACMPDSRWWFFFLQNHFSFKFAFTRWSISFNWVELRR